MTKILYHGSEKIIEKPLFGYGKKYNDYGLGFYCTENHDLAMEWSVDAARDGYANKYELDTSGLEILNLNSGDYCMLHWLTILLENRRFDMPSGLVSDARAYLSANFSLPYNEADIIVGYRADDSYFSFAQDFLNGTISYRQLSNALHLGKLGEQVVLKSSRTFDRIAFLGYEKADCAEWYPRKDLRDSEARHTYFSTERNKRQRGDLYITEILDKEMKADDERLR